MSAVISPFKRLKWGFLPVRRIVDEDEYGNILDEPEIKPAKSNDSLEKEHSANQEVQDAASIDTLEYRDEKDRKWWKFFDEYEYRVDAKTKKNRKWYKWFHDSDTPEERRVILKIDLLLTLYSLAAYWVKYLDQTNLNNAYIGGLKESIGMKGNDLVNTQVMFSVGNIVFQLPFMYILYALPLNYVLPTLDICWSILTVCLYRVTSVGQLKVLRFFIGAFEAPSYIAYHALFASWFKGSTGEITRRAGFYYFGQYLGILTSGLLSGAIERHMGGKNGHEAWQWIFIMDGIISVIVGIIGFYMIPGTPQDCYSIFLSDDDIRIARRRMRADQKDAKPRENPVKHFFKPDIWKSIFSSWHIYVLSLWNIFCWNNNNGTSGAYALWLQSLKNSDGTKRFNRGDLQDYTALTPGLGILWLAIISSFADLFESRWAAIVISQVFNIIGNVILAVWHVPERAKWFAFCLQYFGWAMAPTLYSWQGDICRRDIRERQVVLVTMNILAQQSTAWIAVLVWKTVEAPRYLKGFTFTACSAFALILWTFVVLYFYKKEERLYARENGIVIYNSALDPDFIPADKEERSDSDVAEKE
ncbi:putative permease [Suhomyces tanzawaensis NRRL Y-17324]|uniref:Putative permease n=1 Tax=Suhomyces tanzawaensis NRRL Y-17324 TaxID=984487 RepID=A0A1E4SQA7_9ASCO|nr:putative permease [Suhomyces tanzawaensis NRRL Y-17324]ODV81678.1 putative permease [Suhomyces tanzawaensis NRRL Y-17324]